MQAYKASPLAHSHNVLGPRQPRLGQRLVQRFRIQSCLASVQGGVTTIAVIYKGQKVQEENFRRSDCRPAKGIFSVFTLNISIRCNTKTAPQGKPWQSKIEVFLCVVVIFVHWWKKFHNTQHLCQVRSFFTEVITWHQPKPKHYFFRGPLKFTIHFCFLHGFNFQKKHGNATIPPQKWVTFHTSFICSFFAFPKKNG